jgi:hypothetical protein
MKWNPAAVTAICLWTFAAIFFGLTVGFSYFERPGTSFTFEAGLNRFGGMELWWVVGAFAIGVLGAGAFLLVAGTGLIPYAQKETLAGLLSDAVLKNLYLFLGGIIAAIFQLAQPHTFAPIQALIIGVTWPSVVNQYLGGKEPPPPSAGFQKLVAPDPGPSSGSMQAKGTAGILIDAGNEPTK